MGDELYHQHRTLVRGLAEKAGSGELAERQFYDLVLMTATTPFCDVRETGLIGLADVYGKFDDGAVLRVLTDSLHDSNWLVRIGAMTRLAKVGAVGALDEVEDAIRLMENAIMVAKKAREFLVARANGAAG